MDKKLLLDYARLIAYTGINVEKGEEIWVNASLDQPEFIELLVEELYKAGAGSVTVWWHHDPLGKINSKYMKLSAMARIPPYAMARIKYSAKKLPSMVHIIAEDPDVMKGANQKKIAMASMKSYPKIKPYRDAMDGKYKWTIAAVPNKNWAKKVFPDVDEDEAVELLWKNILLTSRVDGNDPVENWNKHNEDLISKRTKLHDMNLVELRYKANNGTDFKVGLIPGMYWGAGVESAPKKANYNPNIPSEEVFTTPMRGKAEGTLVASMPLSYRGELIEDFSITFENGKVSAVKARKNQKLLEQMVHMDDGASMIGEVALVPYDSPINNSGILFYNTLFDENAACHVALGAGFQECLPGSQEMTPEQIKEAGVNDSMIHVDFMIGTKDLNIVGIDADGKEIQIFKDGNWAF